MQRELYASLLAARHNAKATISFFRVRELERTDDEAAAHDPVRILVELGAVVVACSGAMQRAACGIERNPFCLTCGRTTGDHKRPMIALPPPAEHCVQVRQQLFVGQQVPKRLAVRLPARQRAARQPY